MVPSLGRPAAAPQARGQVAPSVSAKVNGAPVRHQLFAFPVGALIPLVALTICGFLWIWLGLLHGRLPRRRRNDPTTAQAIGYVFLPFFNFYWCPFVYIRLLTRLNEERAEHGLPPLRLGYLMVIFLVCCFVPFVGPVLNLLFVAPLMLSAVQSGVNALVAVCRHAGEDRSASQILRVHLRAGMGLRLAWATYLSLLGTLIVAVFSFLFFFRSVPEDDALPFFLLDSALVGLPLLVGGLSLFARAAGMGWALRRLRRGDQAIPAVLRVELWSRRLLRGLWAAYPLALAAVLAVVFAYFFFVKKGADRMDGQDFALAVVGIVLPLMVTGLIVAATALRIQVETFPRLPGRGPSGQSAAPLSAPARTPGLVVWLGLGAAAAGLFLVGALGGLVLVLSRERSRDPLPYVQTSGGSRTVDSSERAEGRAEIDPNLQGSWKLREIRWSEEKLTSNLMVTSRNLLVINGNEAVRRDADNGRVVETRYSLVVERERAPKVYRLRVVEGPDTGRTRKGIYRIDGNTLILCEQNEGEPPRNFDIVQGQDVKQKYLYTYERE